MQTKKRAKPVKFGKSKTASHPVEKELDVKEIAEADINSDEVKEIKKLIEEKTHVRDEESVKEEVKKQDLDEEEREEEPLEVHLSEESTEEEQKDEEDEDDREEESEDKEEKEPARNASQGNSEREVADKEEEKEMDKQEADDPEEESSSAKATADKEEKESAEEKFTKYGSFTREEVLAPKKKSSFGFFIFVALIAFAVGLAIIAGGSYFLSGFDTKKLTDIKLPVLSEPTATPTAEPSVTPTPEAVDLSAYSISVLNGSGISGEAASLRTQLEDAEFVVDSVGNADTSDYTRTEVFAKEGVSEAYLNTLIKELEKTYEVNSVTETLDESESVDVEIIIGSTRADN